MLRGNVTKGFITITVRWKRFTVLMHMPTATQARYPTSNVDMYGSDARVDHQTEPSEGRNAAANAKITVALPVVPETANEKNKGKISDIGCHLSVGAREA